MRSKDLRPGLACCSGKGLHSKEVRAVRDAAPAGAAMSNASTADAAAALEAGEAGEAGRRPEQKLAPLLHRVVTPAAAANAALHVVGPGAGQARSSRPRRSQAMLPARPAFSV